MDRGDTLLALNPSVPLVPASNIKLLSTAAAFHYLGPDFRTRTFLLASGTRDGSVLRGDLVLYGTGDPTLSDRYYSSEAAPLDTLASRLAATGLREITGDLLVDGSYFQGPELHPEWDPADFNDAFAAPVTSVALAENLVTVRIEAGNWVGSNPSIFTEPADAGLPFDNQASTGRKGTRSRVWLNRETPGHPIGIVGEIPMGGADVWRQLPVSDPLEFTGRQFRRALEARGIRVSGAVRTLRDPAESLLGPRSGPEKKPEFTILAELESPPLLEILRPINKRSNNFLAETVGKLLGRIVMGEGSFEGGSQAVEAFLVDEVGVDPAQIRIRDGSGLSAENRASAAVFVETLAYMADSPHWEAFAETLPVAGVRRELGRMYRTPAAQNLRAKTGTMDSVSALSGEVNTLSGERIFFSILSNEVASEYRAKRAEDQVGSRLASLTRRDDR
jgi:D-alanyl-D-alanine carboxypeptidase/D-alanyl-D-alanine-endopeptidase (penicillin-binding protein 4)